MGKREPINDPDPRDRHVPPTNLDEDGALSPLGGDGLPADISDVSENDDGSADVVFGGEDDVGKKRGASDDADFLTNLADGELDDSELRTLAVDLLDSFDRDREDRSARDEQQAEGIKRTGLGGEAPGGADFTGASRAVHPVLMESCIEFSARAMKELFPAKGPVKTAIIGEQTDSKLDKAERKKTYMNWQFTKQIREYRGELEQTLTQVPLGGSQFLKVWYSEKIGRPRVEFVPVDQMLIPAAAADFFSAARKTHVQHITTQEFQSRIDNGLYKALKLSEATKSSATAPESTASSRAAEKVEGKEGDPFNTDGLRTVYECYCDLELEGDSMSKGELRPYIVTVDETTTEVLAVYRNWDDDSKAAAPEALAWIVEFGFIPWRGAYKIGLTHIIGGLSGALTGALRSILDGGFLSTHAGGLMLKGGRQTGKNIMGGPGEFTELSAPPNVNDIRQLAMPYPFNGPSPVIFQLLDWLTNQAKSVVSTASEAIKDAGSDMPVGTALAMIEQGSITFSAIHARLHESQRQVMEILHRINGQWLDDKVTVEELGELVVSRSDFQGPMDVMPVSDPNVFSDAQRYAQNQAAMAMAEKWPQVFKINKLVSRALKLMNYPDPDEVLNDPTAAKKLDAITENVDASKDAVTLQAYKSQDHIAHIKAHVHFLVSPIFCANPLMAMPAMPKLLAHVKDHLLMLYKEHTSAAGQAAQAIQKAGGPLQGGPQLTGAAFADQELATELAPIMPLLQQAEKLAGQFAPKPPVDPKVQGQLQIAQEKIQAEAQAQQVKQQFEAQQTQVSNAFEAQLKQLELQAKAQAEQLKSQAEAAQTQLQMQVAAQDAALAAQSEDDNRRLQLVLEHMKEDNARMIAAHSDAMNIIAADLKAGYDANTAQLSQLFDSYQGEAQRQFEGMQTLLTQKNASASDAADHQMEREHMAHEAELQQTEHEHKLAEIKATPKPAPAGKGYAAGGLVTRPKTKWNIVRDIQGRMISIEKDES